MDYTDLAGEVIRVGDYIVYAALWDRSATLKYGRVTELAVRKNSWSDKETPTIRVRSVDRSFRGWELQNNGKPITLAFLDRLLVVPPALTPDAALALLRGEA